MRLAAALLVFWCAAAAAELPTWSGGPTPALRLQDLEGKVHTLADYRGKVVLINFWATWCAPCRYEMPSIEKLRDALKGRPFAVLAVNLGEPEPRIRAFLQEVPLRFPVLLDPEAQAAQAWKVKALPATFVVGPDGRVRYRYIGELDWSRDPARKAIVALLPK